MSARPTLKHWRDGGAHFTHKGHQVFFLGTGLATKEVPLLFLHGFPTSSWDWHRVAPLLDERFEKRLVLDFLGYGFSAKPRSYPYSTFDQADVVEELLAHLGLARVHLVAHDFGDSVAQELLARYEERRATAASRIEILSVVFLNGGLFPETHRPRPIQRLLAGPLGGLVARLTTRGAFERGLASVLGSRMTPEERRVFTSEAFRLASLQGGTRIAHRLIGYMRERREQRERWVGALVGSTVPRRLVNGPEDPVSGAHAAERYLELVPNPDVVSLRGVGHYPQIEDPDATARAIVELHDRIS